MENGEPTGEHRHSLLSIFGDLINSGFVVENVWEDGRHFQSANQPESGSEEHFAATVQLYFNMLARK